MMTEQFRKKIVLEYDLNFMSLSKKNFKVEILKAYTRSHHCFYNEANIPNPFRSILYHLRHAEENFKTFI